MCGVRVFCVGGCVCVWCVFGVCVCVCGVFVCVVCVWCVCVRGVCVRGVCLVAFLIGAINASLQTGQKTAVLRKFGELHITSFVMCNVWNRCCS